jgi:hypothetical protein
LGWVKPAISDSYDLWQKFDMPLFLAMALQKCKHYDDLFAYIADIRDRAFPLRQMLSHLATRTKKRMSC